MSTSPARTAPTTDPPPSPATPLALAVPWHPLVPGGCRKCRTRERPEFSRGLCAACYAYESRYGNVRNFAPLPASGNRGTDSWEMSQAHRVVFRNHRRRKQEARDRQRRIWETDSPFLHDGNCIDLRDAATVAA